jgi:hypothetical protein
VIRAVLALAALAAALPARAAEEIAARVDGTAIPAAAVVRRMEGGSLGPAAKADDAVQQLVNEALLAGEARRMGFAGAPDVAEAIDRGVRAAAAVAFLDDIGARAQVDDARLRASFHQTSDFASFDALHYETRADADAALKRIRAGATFAQEAPRAVIARVHPNPAAAPPSMRGETDAGFGPVFGAKPGELVGPLQMANGWAIARLIRKEIGDEAQFAARRPALLRSTRKAIQAEARRHLAEQLSAKTPVQIDESFLGSLDGTSATDRQLDHVIATVKGRPLRYRDIHPTVLAIVAASRHAAGAGVKVSVARQAVQDRLIEDAAFERGFGTAPPVAAQRPEIERTALAAAAAARIQAAAPAPSEKEIESYYERNRAAFGRRFAEVLPAAAAGAAAEKRRAALGARIDALRKKASVSVDAAVVRSLAGGGRS